MIEQIRKFAGDYRINSIKVTTGIEGHGFLANILRNGKVIGSVADYGDGASADISNMSTEERALLDAHAKTKYPEFADSQYNFYTSAFVEMLVNYTKSITDLKRTAKKHPLFEDAELDTHGVPLSIQTFTCTYNEQIKQQINKQYPDIVLINDEILAGI
jgi:hypothetical protein